MVEKVARSISCLALMEEIMNIIYEKWDEILETVKTEHELSDVSFKTWRGRRDDPDSLLLSYLSIYFCLVTVQSLHSYEPKCI